MHTSRKPLRLATIAIAALSASLLALTGCGKAAAPSAAPSSVAIDDKPAAGAVELWAAGGDGAKLPDMFKKFQAANPDVKINMTQIPEADFVSKMTAALSSGKVPDLVYLFTEFQPTLLATGQFQPVPDGLVEPSKFFDWSWNSTVIDGKAYGVPWYSYARSMYYRADLAKAANVKAPQKWDEMVPFLKGLQAQGVKKPLKLMTSPFNGYTAMEFDSFAHQAGGGLIATDLSKWTIDTPQNVKALEFYASLIKDGYSDVDEGDQLDLTARFTQKKTAAAYIGPWFRGWLRDANGQEWVDQNLGVSAMIEGPNGDKAAMVGGGNWAVPTEAQNPTAAWKFARWMAQPEQQTEWVKVFGNLPAVTSAWDDPSLANDANLLPIRESLKVGITVPKVPTWGEVGLAVGHQIERAARGQASASEALKEAQAQADQIGVGKK